MKPNFALSLSFDGIRLLRRAKAQWEEIGAVTASSDDLEAELAGLRALAVADGSEMHSKLILPNEQIRYLTLPHPDAAEEDVRAALDGATPYAVDDLAYDFVTLGSRTHVAAVARETLEEAEAFALTHGFGPLSFVAEPPGGLFPGEPLFGLATGAPDLIGKGRRFVRDNDPAKVAQKAAEEDAFAPGEAGEARPEPSLSGPSLSGPSLSETEAQQAEPVAAMAASDGPEGVEADLPAGTRSRERTTEADAGLVTIADTAPEPQADPAQTDPAQGGPEKRGPEKRGAEAAKTASGADLLAAEEVTAGDLRAGDLAAEDLVAGRGTGPDLDPGFAAAAEDDAEDDRADDGADDGAAVDGQGRFDPEDGLSVGAAAGADTAPPGDGAATRPGVADAGWTDAGLTDDGSDGGSDSGTGDAPTAAAPVPERPGAQGGPDTIAARDARPAGDGAPMGVTPQDLGREASDPDQMASDQVASDRAVAPAARASGDDADEPVFISRLAALRGDRRPLSAERPATLPPGPAVPPAGSGRDAIERGAARPGAPGPTLPDPPSPPPTTLAPTSLAPTSLERPAFLANLPPLRTPGSTFAPGANGASGLKGSPVVPPALPPRMPLPGAGAAARSAGEAPMGAAPARTVVPPPAVQAALRAAMLSSGQSGAGSGGKSGGQVDIGRPVPSLGASLAPVPTPSSGAAPFAVPTPTPAPRARGLFSLRRRSGAAATDPAGALGVSPSAGIGAVADPPSAPAKVKAGAATDASRFAGAARAKPAFGGLGGNVRPVGGKPRYLGLILTALLLAFLAGVAAWAVWPDGGVASLWRGADPVSGQSEIDGGGVDGGTMEAAGTGVDAAPDVAAIAAEAGAEPAPDVASGLTQEPAPDLALDLAPDLAPDLASAVAPVPDVAAPETVDASADEAVAAAAPDAETEAAPEPEPAPAPATVTPVGTGDVLSPAEAERFYAATGVWLRAPRLPLLPQPEALDPDVVAVAAAEPVGDTVGDPPALPALATLAPDSTLPVQVLPPPPDASFARDDRGFILATEAGTLTPYGMLIYAGRPPVLPPSRPVVAGEEGPAPDDARVADPEAALTPDEALATLPAADPAEIPATEVATADVPPTEVLSTAGAVTLDGLRPPVRPDDLAADLAPQSTEPELVAFAGPRPPLRPEGLAPVDPSPEPEAADAGTEAGAPPPEPDVQAALAAIVAAAPDPLASATSQAVAQASRPDARPQNFDRVVAQAQARSQPQSDRAQTAAAASTVPEGGQPVAVASAAVAPTGPVPQSVASAATVENAINLRDVNLIGVYGSAADRRALVRLGNGRYIRVGVGDSLDGGQVAAIGDSSLNYVKRGRTVTLAIPSG